MTKTVNTKRALLAAVLALVVSISMLIGTTFAWFTDSVTSGRNTIQSGNLDVELYYSVLDENGNWTQYAKVDKDTKVFNYDLWEPGYTAVAKFKISNEGSLALKYQLAANVYSEIIGKTKDGADIKLSDYIKYGVTENVDVLKDRATAAAAATTSFGTFNIKVSSLEKGQSAEVGMVIAMPTTVGNVANHDGKNIPSIEFGIALVATQHAFESDSFDHLYDEGINNIDGVLYEKDGNKVVLTEVTEGFTGDTLYVAEGCTEIGENAFAGNSEIDTIVLPSTVTTVADYAFSQTSASNIVLNEGLKTIGNRAFQKNKSLKSITLPSTLESIDQYAFQGTALEEITIPASVTAIDQGALAYNPSLKSITILGNPVIGDGSDTNTPGLNYVARACPNLETVYILGNPTYATTGMIFTNAESGKADNITVYVTSDAAKQALLDATSDDSYKDVIVMDQVTTSDEFKAAIGNSTAGDTIYLAAGEYEARFTNNTSYNLDGVRVLGADGVKLSITSSEVHYGRIQADGVIFENIIFNGTVGATGKATYNNCTFEGRLECASNGNRETYVNYSDINLFHTSVDMSAGNAYIKNSTITKAEYSGASTMTFENCTIGELISWNTPTVLTNCEVEKLDASHMTTNAIVINGIVNTKIQGVEVALTEAAYASVKYHDRTGYTDKVQYVSVYSKDDLVSVNKLIENGVMLHNQTNDIYCVIEFKDDIDFGGDTFRSYIRKNFNIIGNGYTLSNITFLKANDGKAGLIPYAGNNTVSDLTLKNVKAEGHQAGAFAGNATNVKLENCKLEGTVDIKCTENAEDPYYGVGAIFGVNATETSTVKVDTSAATINVDWNGLAPYSGFDKYSNNLVGVIYGGTVNFQ